MALALAHSIRMQALTTSARLEFTFCTTFPLTIMQARPNFPKIICDRNLDGDLLSLRRTASRVHATPIAISFNLGRYLKALTLFRLPLFRPSTPTACPSECLINCNHFSFVYFTCVVRLVCESRSLRHALRLFLFVAAALSLILVRRNVTNFMHKFSYNLLSSKNGQSHGSMKNKETSISSLSYFSRSRSFGFCLAFFAAFLFSHDDVVGRPRARHVSRGGDENVCLHSSRGISRNKSMENSSRRSANGWMMAR